MNRKPPWQQRCIRAVLLLSVMISFDAAAQAGSSPPTKGPVLAVGHGAFLGADGKVITPNLEFILSAQKYYIDALLQQAQTSRQPDKLAVDGARKLIYGVVGQEVLANALFIDWLIEKVRPQNTANVTSINAALRSHYLDKLQHTGPPLRNTKGIDPQIAKNLEQGGITVFLKTRAGGEKYIQECRDAGVPIPPPVFSSAWTNRGAVANEFLDPSAQAELMHYTSSSPAGVCLALPRYESTGGDDFSDEAFLFGLICLGTQSNKACFWDNPRGETFTKDVERDISEFVGGADLVENAQGVCSDCHAGENPFVVHPDKPPFAGLTPSLLPGGWYDPLVDASWPQNPGPTNLLDAVASPGRCDNCHQVGVAGRFPDASTQLPGWCSLVLTKAVGGAPTGTMPPVGYDKDLYPAHIEALKAACDAPPSNGVVVDVDYPDDEDHVSPPIVIDPLYACAVKVAVRGSMLDATVSVFVDGNLVASRVTRNPNFEEFNVPGLQVGDIVTATQKFNGVLSAPSAPVTVRDHTVDFPDGLPAPEVDPGLIYECAEVVAVRHVPGANITVFSNGALPSSTSTSTGWTSVFPGKRPFVVGDSFTAKQQLCTEVSPLSAAEAAVSAPANIPEPTFNPSDLYTGQELVTLETLINGARTSVEEVGTGSLGSFTTPVSWLPNLDVATPLGRPLAAGDQLVASQKLCSKRSTTETPPALDCDELPAPKISHPIVGNNYVVVTQSVPGARIRVYDGGGAELGDGSGTVIVLNRALTGADTITVVQQLGKCTSQTGYRVSARNPSSTG